MYQHTNQNEIVPHDKAVYVVQSYYSQDDSLIEKTKFHISDGQPDNIQNLTCDEIKHVLIRNGMWPDSWRKRPFKFKADAWPKRST